VQRIGMQAASPLNCPEFYFLDERVADYSCKCVENLRSMYFRRE
jgi:hypothetical protein